MAKSELHWRYGTYENGTGKNKAARQRIPRQDMNKAYGVDKVTKAKYEDNIEENWLSYVGSTKKHKHNGSVVVQ